MEIFQSNGAEKTSSEWRESEFFITMKTNMIVHFFIVIKLIDSLHSGEVISAPFDWKILWHIFLSSWRTEEDFGMEISGKIRVFNGLKRQKRHLRLIELYRLHVTCFCMYLNKVDILSQYIRDFIENSLLENQGPYAESKLGLNNY